MLEEMIIEYGAFKTGKFTLASGKESDYYVDLRVAITQPEFLHEVAKAMAAHTDDVDIIAGVALSAVPIAAAISLETEKPYLMIRKESKGHGTQKRVEGKLKEGQKVMFVEDTATTAGSLINAIQCVREAGGIVEKALVIVDREEGAAQNLSEAGVKMHSLASIDRLRELS